MRRLTTSVSIFGDRRRLYQRNVNLQTDWLTSHLRGSGVHDYLEGWSILDYLPCGKSMRVLSLIFREPPHLSGVITSPTKTWKTRKPMSPSPAITPEPLWRSSDLVKMDILHIRGAVICSRLTRPDAGSAQVSAGVKANPVWKMNIRRFTQAVDVTPGLFPR